MQNCSQVLVQRAFGSSGIVDLLTDRTLAAKANNERMSTRKFEQLRLLRWLFVRTAMTGLATQLQAFVELRIGDVVDVNEIGADEKKETAAHSSPRVQSGANQRTKRAAHLR